MAAPDEAAEGTLETRADAGEGSPAEVRLWMDALQLADKEEKDWRDTADTAYHIYSSGKKKRVTFNILYSNVETIVPAVYNSTPVPDIRARDLRVSQAGAEQDPQAKLAKDAATVLERSLVVMFDQYDFDLSMEMATKDSQIGGRGVTRIRYEPKNALDGQSIAYQAVYCEPVTWSEFRRGPGRRWSDVPWIAFRHYMTREQLELLSPENGSKITLDTTTKSEDRDASRGPEAEVFKRALVWEIWDKEKRQVIFVCPSHKAGPITKIDDPLRLRDFYPIPRPLQDVLRPDDLTPVCPFELYRDQAQELEDISKRIARLVRAVKARGIYDAALRSAMTAMQDLDEGEMAPSDQSMATAINGGLDKAIWFMPVKDIVEALVQLVAQREAIKQTIYEIIGISDILRGQVDPREKAAQSNLKAQWGASRLHTRQKDAARYARDLVRLMSEVIAGMFEPHVLQIISAMPIQPELVALLRNDALISFRIDIETDSTIQADIQRSQANIGQFVQGFGTFMQSLAPAVEAGVMPMDIAADLLKSFARSFKLGRQAEDALERLGVQAQQQAHQTAQSGLPPDPEMAKAQAEIARKSQEAQLQAQVEMQRLEIEKMKAQMAMALDQQKMQLAQQQAAMKAAGDQQKLSIQAEHHQASLAMDAAARQQEMQIKAEATAQDMTMRRDQASADMEMKRAEAETRQQLAKQQAKFKSKGNR